MDVVVGQPLHVVVQGVQARGRQDPGLPHPTPEALAPHSRLGHGVPAAHQQRADRGAESLGQAHRHHVGDRAVLTQRGAGRHVGVPDPGAVEVHLGSHGFRVGLQGSKVLDREDRSPGEVVGVLHRDRRGGHEERTHVGGEETFDHRQVDLSPLVDPRPHGHPEEGSVGPQLGASDVGPRLAEHLLAGLHQGPDGQDVAQRTGRGEQGCLVAEEFRHSLLKSIGGRVLGVDVVADLGCGHGRPHRRGGSGQRVGPQIDREAHRLRPCAASRPPGTTARATGRGSTGGRTRTRSARRGRGR